MEEILKEILNELKEIHDELKTQTEMMELWQCRDDKKKDGMKEHIKEHIEVMQDLLLNNPLIKSNPQAEAMLKTAMKGVI